MAHLIEGEYYCETIDKMVKESIEIVVEESEGIKNRDRNAVKHLMEALVLSGVAMSFIGNSRPASGSEHHLSHYWEMKFQMEGKKPILHGIKVGVGMIAVTKMYEMLKEEHPDFAAQPKDSRIMRAGKRKCAIVMRMRRRVSWNWKKSAIKTVWRTEINDFRLWRRSGRRSAR